MAPTPIPTPTGNADAQTAAWIAQDLRLPAEKLELVTPPRTRCRGCDFCRKGKSK